MLSQIRLRLLGGVFFGVLLGGCVIPLQSTSAAWTGGSGALLGTYAGPGEGTLNVSSLEHPLRAATGVVSHNGANLRPVEMTGVKPPHGINMASGEPSRR